MENINRVEPTNELSDNELLHWGIRGMKWGIRRYQNPDGSLTAAGKKKRAAEQTEARVKNIEKRTEARLKQIKEESKVNQKVAKAEAKAQAKIAKAEKKYGLKKDDESEKQKPKSIKDMSNEEIQSKIERIRLENTLKQLSPQKESKGKAFVESAMRDVVAPAAKNVGRNYLEKTLKDKLGLNEKKDPIDSLKKEYDKLVLQKNIKNLKDEDDSVEKLSKKQRKLELERNIRNLENDDDELTQKKIRNEKARLDKEYENMNNPDIWSTMERENKNYRTWTMNNKYREQFYKDMESKGYTDSGSDYMLRKRLR